MGYFTNPLKTEDIMHACANRMYQASPQGEGPRNEANHSHSSQGYQLQQSSIAAVYICTNL